MLLYVVTCILSHHDPAAEGSLLIPMLPCKLSCDDCHCSFNHVFQFALQRGESTADELGDSQAQEQVHFADGE